MKTIVINKEVKFVTPKKATELTEKRVKDFLGVVAKRKLKRTDGLKLVRTYLL